MGLWEKVRRRWARAPEATSDPSAAADLVPTEPVASRRRRRPGVEESPTEPIMDDASESSLDESIDYDEADRSR